MPPKKLAIVLTHPIQYYAPVFKLLTERGLLEPKVFYSWGKPHSVRYDPGFRRLVQWDIPLLEGYNYKFLKNYSLMSDKNHFLGSVNFSLNREIEIWEADAVLVIGWNFYSHVSAMLHFNKRIPVFFRGDSTLLDEKQGMRPRLRNIFLNWLYKHVDAALYVGANSRDYFLKYGLKEEQLFFAPHAIDNARFQADTEENKKKALIWRKSVKISEEDIVFLFAAKFEARKNPLLLLEAFKQFSMPGAHLIFVGNGILEEELKRRASVKNIHFIDFNNQTMMPVVYRLGNVFVLPSQYGESWGLAVNEAMACGLPVLVSNRCGCARDLVSNGQNGYIFESGDRNELCGKMKEMLNLNKLKFMGDVSLEIIQEWSLERLCNGIEQCVLAYTDTKNEQG
jgi:glycosyltransferase involved in cell wall biosynthesis